MNNFPTKLITPLFVFTSCILISFAPIDPNGKENLLLALISGYFGNLATQQDEKLDKMKDNKRKPLL